MSTFRIRQSKKLDFIDCTQVGDPNTRIYEMCADYANDHCIDVLRQAILCHADVSLFTLQWSQAEPMPRADFSNEHDCVNWDVLNAWAADRTIPQDKMKSLRHPLFGESPRQFHNDGNISHTVKSDASCRIGISRW